MQNFFNAVLLNNIAACTYLGNIKDLEAFYIMSIAYKLVSAQQPNQKQSPKL
jgi:hypothetical protein